MNERVIQISVVFFMLAGLFFAISYSINSAEEKEQVVPAVDRSGMVLLENSRSDTDDFPFILEAKIILEAPYKVIFDVKYFMSDTIDGSYNISIHPDMGDWSYSGNTLRPGLNTETITVSFRGKKSPNAQSQLMHMYISKHADRKYIGKIFDRTVHFSKEWAKAE